MEERIRAYINEVRFNNGEALEIKENDIVLFVGPNNAGKSQSLRDIFVRSNNDSPAIVVSDVKIKKSEGSLKALLCNLADPKDRGSYLEFQLMSNTISFNKSNGESSFKREKKLGHYQFLFIGQLTAEARLGICQPAHIINMDDSKNHPIHYAVYEYKYGKWLSQSFHKAFGYDLTPNRMYGATIPLCIGPEVKLGDSYDNEQERMDAYSKILGSYPQVQLQGDGVKSFTGILLYLMLDHYCTYLIDEPESFLHPPQARIMGQIIGETLKDKQQAFIATHSEDIIKGLLDVCEDRLKIVRITRKENTNSFSILNNEHIKDVFGDPLLKYSNIMSSLFHQTVVLCESDSDCKLYSIIANHIKQSEGKYSESLFIHCGGKHRMARTVEALKTLDIDVKLIVDIDLLDDKSVLERIVTVFGIEWDTIKSDYNVLVSNLHSSKETVNRKDVKNNVERILSSSNGKVLSQKEISEIRDCIKTVSKWSAIKQGGKQAIPAGDATNAFNRLSETLEEHGVFLVPVGELEGFVKEVGGHGPEWVNQVLEKYPDFDHPVYQTISDFIKRIDIA